MTDYVVPTTNPGEGASQLRPSISESRLVWADSSGGIPRLATLDLDVP